jgi:methylglutaconyl-CoA hydratase
MSAPETRPDAPLVVIRDDGAIRTLTLNRPQRRNALNDAMLGELADALRDAQADSRVRVIVLAGAGPCFCSGRDQRDAGAAGAQQAVLQDGSLQRSVSALTDVLALLVDSPQPTVASIHGFALAAGQALTLACDFVVAERDARFGNPEMRFGFPAAMNTVLLARHLGRRKALEIAMTGALCRADEYAALGLVNRLADPGSRSVATDMFAAELAALAPWSVRETKRLLRAVETCGIDASLHAGDALNRVLRANAQLAPVFDDVPGTSERLRRELGQGKDP